jgi:hypothetical protein
VDKASKLGYNDHALQPGSKDAAKHYPLSRAVPFSAMKDRAYTIPEQTKRPSPMDGLMNDDGKYRQAIQPRQAGSLSNKPDGDKMREHKDGEITIPYHTKYLNYVLGF